MQSHDVESTFLVEHYRPGFDVGQLRTCVTTVRDGLLNLAQSQASTRILCSLIVPQDEAFMIVFEAKSEQQVIEVFSRTTLAFDRISAVIAEITPPDV